MFTKAAPYCIEVNSTISRELILSLLSKKNFNSLTLTGLVEIVVLDFDTEALKDFTDLYISFASSGPISIKKLLNLFGILYSPFIPMLLTIILQGKSGCVFIVLPITFS